MTPIERVVEKLESGGFDPIPEGSDKWESRCPAHNGSRHNLTIGCGLDGRVLLHCHHEPGCSTETIAQALGIAMNELFMESNGQTKSNDKAKTKGKKIHKTPEDAGRVIAYAKGKTLDRKVILAGKWLYRSSDGRPLMAVLRLDLPEHGDKGKDKTYIPVHPVEGGWVCGDPSGKLPLYNLSGIVKSDRVYIMEGEKIADLVCKLGLVATTTPHGAKSPWKSDFSPLAGKEIIALPDHDQPGENYVNKIASLVAGLDPRPTFRILRLPLTAEGDDIEQWLKDVVPDSWTEADCRTEFEKLADEAGLVDLQAIFKEGQESDARKNKSAATYPEPSANGADHYQAGGVHGPKSRRKRKKSWIPRNRFDLPDVEVNTLRDIVLEETLKALVKDPDLYCRGDTLGVVIQELGDTSSLPGGIELRNAKGNLRFIPLSKSVLGCRLTQNASFFYWTKGKNDEDIALDCHPPDWLIAAVAEHRYWPGLRELMSITQIPYVLSDGSLASPGFDQATGTLYHPSIEIQNLPKRPTRADAIEAKDRLYQLVYQFPFENGYSFSVWLAALLSAVQRPIIAGAVPGFVFNGNKAGCGKGLLIDIIGNITLGHRVATRTYPIDPNEAEKIKLALALAAVPIVHFDNLIEGGYYGGGVMDSALTSTVTSGRILGQSRDSGDVPLRPVWMISGNNVSPMGDADRRWLPCNLVTSLDRPHERDDIQTADLREHVLNNRGDILRETCIILKAHAIAGRPRAMTWDGKPSPPLGSFEEWDTIVRGAVWYATKADCLHTQRKTSDEMPSRVNKVLFLEGWKEIDPDG